MIECNLVNGGYTLFFTIVVPKYYIIKVSTLYKRLASKKEKAKIFRGY